MAIERSVDTPPMINKACAQAGAACWTLGAVLSLGALVAYVVNWWPVVSLVPQIPAFTQVLILAWLLAGVAALICGIFLLRGRVWAHPTILSLACLYLVYGLSVVFKMVIEKTTGVDTKPLQQVAVIAQAVQLAFVLAVVALLWAGSAKGSRLRYASNVIITTALALVLFVVANFIAQSKGTFYRRDVQWLGQYGLSERSRKVLAAVKEHVTVTSLYATGESNATSVERAHRVWELLSEIHDLNPQIEVARAASDSDRADILARVAQQMRGRSPAYAKLIDGFLAQDANLLVQLRSQQSQWRQLASSSYLDLWAYAAHVSDVLKVLVQGSEGASGLEQIDYRLRKELEGVPDYAKLTDDIKGYCDQARTELTEIDATLKQLAKIPSAVAANRASAVAKIDALVKAMQSAASPTPVSGPEAASGPASAESQTQPSAAGDSTALLRGFLKAVDDAAEKATAVAEALDEIAGPENAQFVRRSTAWLIGGPDAMFMDSSGNVEHFNLTGAYFQLADALSRLKMRAEGALQSGTKEYQAKTLADLRGTVARSIEAAGALNTAAKKAIESLASVDAPTAKILKEVADGSYFQDQISQFARCVDAAAALPPIASSTLASDLADENTILIETVDKTEAVRFDQVWPLLSRPPEMGAPEGPEKRVFSGDSAISAKILGMTQKPCAVAVLAYAEAPRMPQMGQEGGGINPGMFQEMQNRLRRANFHVATWNMAEGESAAGAVDPNDRELPRVLIVLPPTPASPMTTRPDDPAALGPKFMAKMKHVIDTGEVSGAIFLAQFQPPAGPYDVMPARYGWNDYLNSEWGVEARTGCLVLPTERDETGQKFRLSPMRLEYLPLSSFSDQPIGKPLQGERVFWYWACPVTTKKTPQPGVSIEPLLTVPASWTSTWGACDFPRLVAQFRETGSYFTPDFEHGDLKPPFDVAVAAKRQGDPNEGAGPSRIVVLGMGESFSDSYVTSPVRSITESSAALEEPPRSDLDVIVNSAYWLCGREDYIASGPVQVQPIRSIKESTRQAMEMLCIVGLPVALLCVGGLVLLMRRR